MRYLELILFVWRQRLARLREMAADVQDGNSWLWRARARILTFLVSRYSDPDALDRPHRIESVATPTVCRVEPVDTPARPRELIAGLLHAVSAANFEARQRLRWRWF